MVSKKRILLVEGNDDLHSISSICQAMVVTENFSIEKPGSGGIENVLRSASVTVLAGSDAIERLGIVVDADDDLDALWQRVRSILEKAGYEDLPEAPNPAGTIVEQDYMPTFGVWVMPDNQLKRGYLETFLAAFVPQDETWNHAKASVAALANKPFVRQDVDHTAKAEIHTFLAWQEEPGKPFGQAITARYLTPDNPTCKVFADWLRTLFC